MVGEKLANHETQANTTCTNWWSLRIDTSMEIDQMERIYHPSMRRVILFRYVAPVVACGMGLGTVAALRLIRGEPANFNWTLFTSFLVALTGWRLLGDGLRAERFAIKITPAAISGPIAVGRAEPIPFNEIDFQRTFKPGSFAKTFLSRRVYSVAGDQIFIDEWLFPPRQVSEIWSTLERAQHQQGSD